LVVGSTMYFLNITRNYLPMSNTLHIVLAFKDLFILLILAQRDKFYFVSTKQIFNVTYGITGLIINVRFMY